MKTLHDAVQLRLRRIVSQQFKLVVGDAQGADTAFQSTLKAWDYPQVEVFFTGKAPRNNVGAWPTRAVRSSERRGTAAFYSAKDQVLAQVATVGLMVWDGKSAGTLTNAGRLVSLGKACVVFHHREAKFSEVRTPDELDALVALASAETQLEFRRRLHAEQPTETAALL
ncbi:MAG: hypothetical protein ACO1OB_30265 [Archangium sp.]